MARIRGRITKFGEEDGFFGSKYYVEIDGVKQHLTKKTYQVYTEGYQPGDKSFKQGDDPIAPFNVGSNVEYCDDDGVISITHEAEVRRREEATRRLESLNRWKLW